MTAKTKTQNAADRRAGQSAEKGKEFSSSPLPTIILPRGTGAVNTQSTEMPFNELVVRCLRIAIRRGRAIREAQAREAAEAAAVEVGQCTTRL